MPIYEYVCKQCEGRFEELVMDHTTPPCPRCGNAEVARTLSAFAVGRGNSGGGAPPPQTPCGGCPNPGACGFN